MPLLLEKTSSHECETLEIAHHFSDLLKPGHVVGLSGDLGSGKTTFVRGICAALKIRETVTSPTFTLMNEYHGKMPVYHFDFYRLSSPDELHDLGLEEYFYGDGIVLIEWPELVSKLVPTTHYEIHLKWELKDVDRNRRHIQIYHYE
jgi:tRNA threonylcarbamoyladenosine biosynthesis protein TsaE